MDALQPMKSQLVDLMIIVTEDIAWNGLEYIRPPHLIDYCLNCNISSFSELASLERLGVPMNWLTCYCTHWNSVPMLDLSSEDRTTIAAEGILPSSLQELVIQLPGDWCPWANDEADRRTMRFAAVDDEENSAYALAGIISNCQFIQDILLQKATVLPALRKITVWTEAEHENYLGRMQDSWAAQENWGLEKAHDLGVDVEFVISSVIGQMPWPLGQPQWRRGVSCGKTCGLSTEVHSA